MEGCLKKLALEAEAMGFGDPWKGGWEPMGASGTKTVPGGLDWKQSGVYSQPLEGQKTNSGLSVLLAAGLVTPLILTVRNLRNRA